MRILYLVALLCLIFQQVTAEVAPAKADKIKAEALAAKQAVESGAVKPKEPVKEAEVTNPFAEEEDEDEEDEPWAGHWPILHYYIGDYPVLYTTTSVTATIAIWLFQQMGNSMAMGGGGMGGGAFGRGSKKKKKSKKALEREKKDKEREEKKKKKKKMKKGQWDSTSVIFTVCACVLIMFMEFISLQI